MKIETVVWTDLKASAHLLSGSMLSYITSFSFTLRIKARKTTEMSAFKVVTWRT